MSIPDPDGWSYDPDYDNGTGTGAWWHEDCLNPTELPDGSLIGGIAVEERVRGKLVAIVCLDCDEVIPMRRRPE